MTALRIAVAGLGTVGAGVVKLLTENGDEIAARAGRAIEIVGVSARNRSRARGIDISGFDWFDDAAEMATLNSADAVVELIGGSDGTAKVLAEKALEGGKHVVTANKALIAHHGSALAALAETSGAALLFEAAVAGGIPVIKAIRDGLAANRMHRISGILNGTCNYILTEMERTGRSFADVLKEAQRLGYAEADPSFDVGGIDAGHKIAILAAIGFGQQIDFEGVSITGIEEITTADLRYADEFGYRVLLLAAATRTDDGTEQVVRPVLMPRSAPLAAVTGVFNAVQMEGTPVGRIFLEGPGAGEGPTASAVVADLVELARAGASAPLGKAASSLGRTKRADPAAHVGPYYLRINAADRPGSMAAITSALADAGVSMEEIRQHGDPVGNGGDTRLPVVIITHDTSEATMTRAMALMEAHADVIGAPLLLRIETLSRAAESAD